MGQTLKGAAKLTSASEAGEGKLAYNHSNQAILNDIIKFVESYARENPDQGKYVFKSPLTWITQLKPPDFSGDYEQSGDDLLSNAKGKDGNPLLSLNKKAGQYEISVSTFEQLENVIKASADKVAETRACLEGNMDPLINILGDRFATVQGPDSASQRFVEEIIKTKAETEEETASLEEKKCEMNIMFKIKELDSRLLLEHITLGKESHSRRINAADVEHEVLVLQNFAGNNSEKHALESITFAEPYTYVYENGCRAPSKRQVFGEICYLEVKLHDCDVMFITASTSGYFFNKGFDKESNQLDFEKDGDIKPNLVVLLGEKSGKFSEIIYDKNLMPVEDKPTHVDTTADLDADHEYDHTQAADQQDGVTQQQEKDKNVQRQKGDKKTEKKNKLEPSIKWKNLELEEHKTKDISQKEKRKPKFVRKSPRGKQKISDPDLDSSFEESSSESEEEEETPDRRNESNADLPSEYWQIQKLVKYLKGGNQTATIIALCSMRDFNLAQETCQLAIRDVGGLEVLINLLDTDDIKCKIGSLKILKEISRNTQIRRAIADLGGLQTMVKILRDQNKDLKCLAAETIANVAKFRRARRTVRQHGGIKKLVALLDCATLTNSSTADVEKGIEVARSGALALWSCSKSTKNKQAMRKAGAIPLLARLLKSPHENMLIPVVGTLQECASEPSYRLAIRTEGMIEDLVNNLQSENQELQMHCASAIFKCAEEKETRDLVRHYGGLDPLVSLLSQTENKELLAAATGAIWKCAISGENVTRFQELKAIDMLVALLNDQPEEVLVNVVGALGECAKDPPNRMTIRKAGGIQPLVNLLTGTNQALLVNVTRAVGQCAEEPDNMIVIDKLDGVRLLWSLLKNQNQDVQASAAWAICPCIENAKDAGEMVRSFVGGLELIVSLLKSEDKEVLASVCAAIANIANDEENLAVITDHGVVPMLAKLTNTTDDKLRRHLAEAIARCCNWGNNRVAFGDAGAVAPLGKYLKSSDEAVHRSTARALFQLSKDPDNCITMHDNGVVKPLMEMVGAQDSVLQDAAAGCIANIRRLALANEKSKHR